ncbi:MAG: T9SS type A sorting domain-containing protein [Ignavibacteria bacterium]|nr:T9SS type A sorting domain-containing protein [Ignavibacteria bacterium]
MGSGTGFDYATLKYDSAGNLKWEKRYNGPGNGTDSALAMRLNGTSDVYVSGASFDTLLDYATIKYDAATGDSIWVARYNGPGNGNDIARAIVLRGSSEVYVTGGSQDSANGLPADYDYATIKYASSDGGVDWVSRYNGTADGDDQAYAISVQSTSRVYVTGRSLQTGSFNDIVTVRYNQGTGDESWLSAYNGTANDDDGGVAISGGNNPYVIGPSAGAGVGLDYATVQYNGSNGNENFSLRYNGTANGDDVPYAIVSSGGAVYVTGTSNKTKGSEFLTIKYVDPNKMKYRTFIQDSFAVKAANLKTSAPPNGGNVRDEAMTKAYPKIKKGFAGYPGGLVVGNARPDSASSYGWMRFDKGKGVAGYVPDTGPARGFDFYGTDPFVGEKKNPKRDKHDNHLAGELIALRVNIGASDAEVTPPTLGDLTYDDGDTSNHFNGMTLRAIATLADNYLTYWKKYPSVDWPHLDSIFARVNRAFTGPLGVVSKQPLVVTGAVLIDSIPFLAPAIAPLVEPLSFPPGSLDLTPERYALYLNYPNPFNPTTTIEFDLSEQSIVSLKVYDILGREVATVLDNEQMDEGNQEVTFDASNLSSGMYFYRLNVNNGQFQQIKKMMLIK